MVGYQNLARILWPAYAKRRVMFASDELLICEWRCHGEARPWGLDRVAHAELDLPRAGMHVRAPSARRQHVIDPATAGFARAGDEYRRASPTAQPATSTLVAMRGTLADSLVPRRCSPALAVSAAAARLHFRLARAVDPLEIEELALGLVRRTLVPEVPHALPVSPGRRRLAEEIEHVIATRFTDRLTLDEIARLCKTSPFHASRVFRSVTGETVHRRLTRVRLWSALFELHRGERPSQIALATGFSSHSHFTSAFRAELGIVPSRVCALDTPALPRRARTRRS
jgi:AraC family transcriptional regulator